MVLGKLPVLGRPTILITVGQGPTALAVGAGGGCLDVFTLIYPFFPLSPSLWETARYRLKYCLKGPLNPKQPTNHIFAIKLTLNGSNLLIGHCFHVVTPIGKAGRVASPECVSMHLKTKLCRCFVYSTRKCRCIASVSLSDPEVQSVMSY